MAGSKGLVGSALVRALGRGGFGWQIKTSFEQLVNMMTDSDLAELSP